MLKEEIIYNAIRFIGVVVTCAAVYRAAIPDLVMELYSELFTL